MSGGLFFCRIINLNRTPFLTKSAYIIQFWYACTVILLLLNQEISLIFISGSENSPIGLSQTQAPLFPGHPEHGDISCPGKGFWAVPVWKCTISLITAATPIVPFPLPEINPLRLCGTVSRRRPPATGSALRPTYSKTSQNVTRHTNYFNSILNAM